MTPTAQRPTKAQLGTETLLAACLGLIPVLSNRLNAALDWPWLLTRVDLFLRWVLGIGVVPAMLLGACMDIGGLTTNWRWLSDLEGIMTVVFSMLIFGGLWFLRRSSTRGSTLYNLPAAILLAWFMFAIPMAFFGMMWIVD